MVSYSHPFTMRNSNTSKAETTMKTRKLKFFITACAALIMILGFFILYSGKNKLKDLNIQTRIVSHNQGSSMELEITIDPENKIKSGLVSSVDNKIYHFKEGVVTALPIFARKHLDKYFVGGNQSFYSPNRKHNIFYSPKENPKYILFEVQYKSPLTNLLQSLFQAISSSGIKLAPTIGMPESKFYMIEISNSDSESSFHSVDQNDFSKHQSFQLRQPYNPVF